MITAINIKNFKALQDTGWIPVDGNVVFIGPNNSGKTTALQALSLWNFGLQKWIEKKKTSKALIRTGVVLNRKDLFAIPVTSSKHIWTNLFPLSSERSESGKIMKTRFNNIEISVKGETKKKEWICGLEFRYDSEEVIYVKPLHDLENNIANADIEFLKDLNVAFLPPMSGLKTEEVKILFQTVEYNLGEGRTAEVLGNLCYQIINPETDILKAGREPEKDWQLLTEKINKLFLAEILKPEIDSRGFVILKYRDRKGIELPISSAGRGMQQIILLIAYLLIKPNCIILLDEPDAHLEILKQEQVYELLSELAQNNKSQLLIASHSEVIMRKAVNTNDKVLAFYPHTKPKFINDRGSELLKSLRTIGFEEYYLAHQTGWILYIEGGLDLPILKKFAEKTAHPVLSYLEDCFYKTINTNDPPQARQHFTGLKDAKPDLTGIAIYDHIDNPLNVLEGLHETRWNKNEIENYFYSQRILLSWAIGKISQDLFGTTEATERENAMQKALEDVLPGAARRDEHDPYWSEVKASAEIEKVIKAFHRYMGYPGNSSKAKFIDLIDYMSIDEINKEITQKLDFIYHLVPNKINA